jgi:RNA polymerase sigma-70 factor (ECF subfamily)
VAFDEVLRADDPVVAAAQGGDHAAFDRLVRRHQNEVYTLALRLTADRDVAMDVAQDAFIRAWRALPGFRGDARFSTWLHRITVNVAWTTQRRRRRHRADSIDDMAVHPEAGGLSPEAAGEASDLRPRLAAAIGALPAAQRTVVVLKDIHGWSHGEIAEELGITVAAAKVRLHRARRTLRGALFDAGIERREA